MAIGPQQKESKENAFKRSKDSAKRLEQLLDSALRKEMDAGNVRRETDDDMGLAIWENEFYLVEARDAELGNLIAFIPADAKKKLRVKYVTAGWKRVSFDEDERCAKFYTVY